MADTVPHAVASPVFTTVALLTALQPIVPVRALTPTLVMRQLCPVLTAQQAVPLTLHPVFSLQRVVFTYLEYRIYLFLYLACEVKSMI